MHRLAFLILLIAMAGCASTGVQERDFKVKTPPVRYSAKTPPAENQI